jgi:hypothetical protein
MLDGPKSFPRAFYYVQTALMIVLLLSSCAMWWTRVQERDEQRQSLFKLRSQVDAIEAELDRLDKLSSPLDKLDPRNGKK